MLVTIYTFINNVKCLRGFWQVYFILQLVAFKNIMDHNYLSCWFYLLITDASL